MINIHSCTVEKLAELQDKLAKYRERLADVRVEYETLKDKKGIFADEIKLRIKNESLNSKDMPRKLSASELNGKLATNEDWVNFSTGLEEARKRYIKGKIYVDNLETEWETMRTIIANLRKERFNT